MATPRKKANERKRANVEWGAVEMAYLTNPTLSLRELATRLCIPLPGLMARAHRGQWAAKRAAAKGKLETPDSPPLVCTEPPADGGANANGLQQRPGDTGDGHAGEPGDGRKRTENDSKGQETDNGCNVLETNRQKKPFDYLTPAEIGARASQVQNERAERFTKEMAGQASRLPGIMAKLTDTELLMYADKIAKIDAVSRKSLGIADAEGGGKAPLVQIQLLGTISRESVPTVLLPVTSA